MQAQVKTVTTSDQQSLCVKTWGDEENTIGVSTWLSR
jgi:hypothetical protein